ncbi:MAG: hypothetical protein Fur005_14680 [Roseiflexaceae bacterium]
MNQRAGGFHWWGWIVAVLIIGSDGIAPAQAAGITWSVASVSDSISDGDLSSHTGSFRFVLNHASAGDLVLFDGLEPGDIIFVASPLSVPSGVAVGSVRGASCGGYTLPAVNLSAGRMVNPVLQLQSESTLHGINIGGGSNALRISGAGVEVCGVGLGITADSEGITPSPPVNTSLIIDAAQAIVRQSYLNGDAVVTVNGSDSRIGDTLTGSGDANAGVRSCSITIQANASMAARRVTIRDPFARILSGMSGSGIFGGDDLVNHANAWAQTPSISSAISTDGLNYATVIGQANPNSWVDLYIDTQVSVDRVAVVRADSTGAFQATITLAGQVVPVFAISTLADPAAAGRLGSSSQRSGNVLVSTTGSGATPTPTPTATASPTPTTSPTLTTTPPIERPYRDWLPLVVR